MEKFKKKVQNSSNFYNESFVKFDFKLTEYNYLTIKKFFKGSLALELGPAIGQMTKYIVNDFSTLHLVEGSKTLLEQIPNYPNIIKHHSYFEEFKTDLKFDTIIMGHVLEHVEDPANILKCIHNWLSDDGVLIISVPNAKSIHRIVGVEMGILKNVYELNERDHDAGHYRVYDIDSLKKEANDAGFKVIHQGGIFFKPLSNMQIETNWNAEMIEGFFKISDMFPFNCAEIYIVCTK